MEEEMKHSVKFVSLLAISTLVLSVLAGCASAASTTAPAATTEAPAAATAVASEAATTASGPVTEVTFWADWGGDRQPAVEQMVSDFNASHPNIHVTYVYVEDPVTKFLTASTSGQAPDVMIWDRNGTALYAPKGVLEPLDDYMAKDGISADTFYAEALREMTYDGKVYGLPMTVDCRALFYNKKLFSEAGITNPPTNWDELEQDAVKLTKWDGDKLQVSGFSLSDAGLFSMYLMQAGGQMLSDDNTKTAFNSDAGLAVLNYWDKLINQDKVYQIGFESGLGEGTDAFVTGQVAMMYSGPWALSTYEKYGQDLDFGVAPAPAGPNGDKGSVMGGFGMIIPSAAKNKDAAWEFIKWWNADSTNALNFAKLSWNIPANLKAIEDPFFQDDPFWKPILDTLAFAKIRPTVTGYSPMEANALVPNLQNFMQGKLSAADALKQAQEAGDKILSDNAAQ
jgi:multiple sugar transport system substrate-binding protein